MEGLVPILERAIFKILTEMYFLIPDVDLPAGVAGGFSGPGYTLSLGRRGGESIRFFFLFDPVLGKSMTADFMGLNQSDVTEEMVEGTLRECVNMIVGNLLNEIDSDGSLIMGLPEKCPKRPDWVPPHPDVRLFFDSRAIEGWAVA